jgi:hypothetical protein
LAVTSQPQIQSLRQQVDCRRDCRMLSVTFAGPVRAATVAIRHSFRGMRLAASSP